MKPKLYVFTISHYCEKAKWALDYFALPYELVVLSPLEHRKVAGRLGLAQGSVPFLQAGKEVVQGSTAILDWASQNKKNARSLHIDDPQVVACITRLDEVLGVHVRRFYYSAGIIEQPALVKPIFLHGLNTWGKLKMMFAWPKVRQLMTKYMDLGVRQGEESKRIIETELAWLENLLSQNGGTLSHKGFSAADLSAASLLAPLVLPPEYPVADLMQLPSKIERAVLEWEERPSVQWVKHAYATWRAA